MKKIIFISLLFISNFAIAQPNHWQNLADSSNTLYVGMIHFPNPSGYFLEGNTISEDNYIGLSINNQVIGYSQYTPNNFSIFLYLYDTTNLMSSVNNVQLHLWNSQLQCEITTVDSSVQSFGDFSSIFTNTSIDSVSISELFFTPQISFNYKMASVCTNNDKVYLTADINGNFEVSNTNNFLAIDFDTGEIDPSGSDEGVYQISVANSPYCLKNFTTVFEILNEDSCNTTKYVHEDEIFLTPQSVDEFGSYQFSYSAPIFIYNEFGTLVIELSGDAQWNGIDKNGQYLNPGVYFGISDDIQFIINILH